MTSPSIQIHFIFPNLRRLSTFRVCRYGEARAYSSNPVVDLDGHTSNHKSRLFDRLPTNLASYENWLPGFKLVDGMIPFCPVYVILRLKSGVRPIEASQWRENQMGLASTWWTTVMLPAVASLPDSCRTRHFNPVMTSTRTGILPKYLRLYDEDLAQLDSALQAPSSMESDLSWYFVCCKFGQRKELDPGERLGPESFGLGDAFDLTDIVSISVHLALNFGCTDERYSLFWNSDTLSTWTECE